jgi:uncharacterized membrane protein required for colicin V production
LAEVVLRTACAAPLPNCRHHLVVLVYQLLLTAVVLAILGACTGQVGLAVLYAALGGIFSLALGLLFGAVFSTVSAASASGDIIIFIQCLSG